LFCFIIKLWASIIPLQVEIIEHRKSLSRHFDVELEHKTGTLRCVG